MRNRKMAVITGATLGLAVSLLLAGFARALPANPDSSCYHIVKKIVTGGTEGWDYISMDTEARLASIGRVNPVALVNVELGRVVGKVPGLEGDSGPLPPAESGTGYDVKCCAGSGALGLRR